MHIETHNIRIIFTFLFVSSLVSFSSSANAEIHPHVFHSIYQFGDSISDTGNSKMASSSSDPSSKPPYGETADEFFHRPTGRCSDGLLIVDFIARSLGLPFLNPYLDKSANFKHGVNFAVGGSTALDPAVLAQMNITSFTATNSSLSVQLDWFKAHLHSSCSSSTTTATVEECRKKKLRKALILMGEIGGNDYNYPLFQDTKSIQQLYPLVPYVIAAIKNAVQELIDLGVIHLLVPGNFPIGCAPVYLAEYQSNATTAYDELKCLKDFNNLASLHNHRLQQALSELRLHNPSVSIHYGDYYNAYVWVLREAASLGFEEDGVLKACCGKGDNEYNCDLKEQCGAKGVPVCLHPAKRLSWDGAHLTQHAYKHIAEWLMSNIFGFPTSPTCSNSYVQER